LIVGADSVNSVSRPFVLGEEDIEPLKTGFVAYRVAVDTDLMKADLDMVGLIEKSALNIWYVSLHTNFSGHDPIVAF